jgi:hypothetical protein
MTEDECRFLILMEEAAEIQQRVSNLLRFGINEIEPGQEQSNVTRLRAEICDLKAMIWLLEENGNLEPISDNDENLAIIAKRKKVEKYMKYSIECGRVASNRAGLETGPERCPDCGEGPHVDGVWHKPGCPQL